MKQLITLLLLCCMYTADAGNTIDTVRRINFFVSGKVTKVDPPAISAQLQARWQQLFRKDEFYCIIAGSADEMAERMARILTEKKAKAGNIWFDSHGYFARRRSLFMVGKDEVNAQSIADTTFNQPFQKLARFCDTGTVIGIGSCYGGATFSLPAVEGLPEKRMNGDSLMIRLGQVLNNATVYGSESFVMTGPGMFYAGYTLAGFPALKRFKDSLFQNVWERVGTWNCYNGKTGEFGRVNTVYLNRSGSICTKKQTYLAESKHRKKQQKILAKCKKGNYNLALLYQYN
jgi:hypothetical protein